MLYITPSDLIVQFIFAYLAVLAMDHPGKNWLQADIFLCGSSSAFEHYNVSVTEKQKKKKKKKYPQKTQLVMMEKKKISGGKKTFVIL